MTDRAKLVSRPWQPQDLIDDLQSIIDEEPDNYLNTRRTTLCMARDYLKEHFAEQKWIPVSERLPDIELVEVRAEDMELFPCLVVKSAPQSYKKRFVTKAWYDGKGFMDTDCIWITKSVTHWMPLPEPPKEDNHD